MNQVLEIQGRLYQVVRTIPVWQVNGNIEALKAWTEALHADRSFRHGDKFYIVTDIIETDYEQIT